MTSNLMPAPEGGRALKLEAFAQAERRTSLAQTKVTPTEYAALEAIRDDLHSLGLPEVTISSLLRTFVLNGIRAYEEERGVTFKR